MPVLLLAVNYLELYLEAVKPRKAEKAESPRGRKGNHVNISNGIPIGNEHRHQPAFSSYDVCKCHDGLDYLWGGAWPGRPPTFLVGINHHTY